MTAEEDFCDLEDKYGEDFNWHLIPLTNETFVKELKKEIGANHFLYNKTIWAVAKCDSNDDVLFVTREELGKDIYYIIHLTYTDKNIDGYPMCETFTSLEAVKEFIEQSYVLNYL